MQGNIVTKALRASLNLLGNPRFIRPYLGSQVTTPVALGLPWISYTAIEFIETAIRPGMTVFEYGAGGSTIFFASRGARVVSIESNAGWANLVRQKLAELGLGDKVEVREVALDQDAPGGYAAALDEAADLILVDSEEDYPRLTIRPQLFAHAQEYVKPRGMVVLDDAWRYGQLSGGARQQAYRRFQSVGPCRPGVTATDVYFYS